MLLAAGLLLVAVAVVPLSVEVLATAGDRHGVADAPDAPVAIVLGAGVDGAGRPSPFLAARLDAAIRLYRSGRVKVLLMSGDHSTVDHDEVDAMSRYAQARGVPAAAIALDHAGFDTYSSCYRARSVWGIRRAIVISQSFHLPRAVWLCRRLGVDADGVVASDDGYRRTSDYGWVREIPAADKAMVDLLIGRTPTFPGPRDHSLDHVLDPASST